MVTVIKMVQKRLFEHEIIETKSSLAELMVLKEKQYKLSHKIIIGDSQKMPEIPDRSVGLAVTSPPYFVMRGAMEYDSYDKYLDIMKNVFKEVYRVLKTGRIFAVNISDYKHDGIKYPIPADMTIMLRDIGFNYCEDIIWIKPKGMSSDAGSRAGVVIQNPYPLQFYPDLRTEHILVLSKGEMGRVKYKLPYVEESKININEVKEFLSDAWYFSTEKNPDNIHPAMFPLTLPLNVIRFYSYVTDVVLDPFAGTGTTMLAAKKLRRSSIGIELKPKYVPTIKSKVGWGDVSLTDDILYEILERDIDA